MIDKLISTISESFIPDSFQLAQGFNFHTPLFLPGGNSANADLLYRSAATQVRMAWTFFLEREPAEELRLTPRS
jgi:hypothetical protein